MSEKRERKTSLEMAEKKLGKGKGGKYTHLEAREALALRKELKRLREIERRMEEMEAYGEEIAEAIGFKKFLSEELLEDAFEDYRREEADRAALNK